MRPRVLAALSLSLILGGQIGANDFQPAAQNQLKDLAQELNIRGDGLAAVNVPPPSSGQLSDLLSEFKGKIYMRENRTKDSRFVYRIQESASSEATLTVLHELVLENEEVNRHISIYQCQFNDQEFNSGFPVVCTEVSSNNLWSGEADPGFDRRPYRTPPYPQRIHLRSGGLELYSGIPIESTIAKLVNPIDVPEIQTKKPIESPSFQPRCKINIATYGGSGRRITRYSVSVGRTILQDGLDSFFAASETASSAQKLGLCREVIVCGTGLYLRGDPCAE